MIYFCMIASLSNARLRDVGTVIFFPRSTNSFGLIVYHWASSLFKNKQKSKDILKFGTGKPFFHLSIT